MLYIPAYNANNEKHNNPWEKGLRIQTSKASSSSSNILDMVHQVKKRKRSFRGTNEMYFKKKKFMRLAILYSSF